MTGEQPSCPRCIENMWRLDALTAAVSLIDPEAVKLAALLRQLLPVLAAIFGSEPFTLSDARRHAGVLTILRDRSSTAVGKLFARAAEAGVVVDGYELEQLGRHGSRALWRVWRRAG
jgi:hypothetical protein